MDTQKIVNRILEHPAFNKSNIENYDAEDFRQLINELVHEEDRSIQILEMTNETLNESLNTARSELEQLKLIINEETSSLSQEEENLLHLEHNINQTAANISSNRESIIEHQNNMEELLNFSELVTDFFNSFSEPYGLLIFFLSLYLLGKISKEILMEYKKFKEKKDKWNWIKELLSWDKINEYFKDKFKNIMFGGILVALFKKWYVNLQKRYEEYKAKSMSKFYSLLDFINKGEDDKEIQKIIDETYKNTIQNIENREKLNKHIIISLYTLLQKFFWGNRPSAQNTNINTMQENIINNQNRSLQMALTAQRLNERTQQLLRQNNRNNRIRNVSRSAPSSPRHSGVRRAPNGIRRTLINFIRKLPK